MPPGFPRDRQRRREKRALEDPREAERLGDTQKGKASVLPHKRPGPAGFGEVISKHNGRLYELLRNSGPDKSSKVRVAILRRKHVGKLLTLLTIIGHFPLFLCFLQFIIVVLLFFGVSVRRRVITSSHLGRGAERQDRVLEDGRRETVRVFPIVLEGTPFRP